MYIKNSDCETWKTVARKTEKETGR